MENVTGTNTPASTGERRLVVLVVTGNYLPGYKSGGPLRAIAGLTEALGDEFDFKIITSDRDLGDKKPYEGIRTEQWMQVGKADVLYVDGRNPFTVIRHILKTPHDVLYLKSFFCRPWSMWPVWMRAIGILRTRNIVVAPIGQFAPGALALKRIRKRVYITIAKRLWVYKKALWHATSVYEAEDVKREFGTDVQTVTARSLASRSEAALREQAGLRMIVASELHPVGAATSLERHSRSKSVGKLRLVYLARVARNKNLIGALNFLKGLQGNVTFDIYGPLEDKQYWSECQRVIAELPKNIQARYRGSVPHEDVSSILADYHVFFLPSMGESFSYSILEALLAGCPILISDKTPWRDLESVGVGWDLPLDSPEQFRGALQRCIDMRPEEYVEYSARAQEYGWLHSQNPEIVSQNRRLFQPERA